MTTIHIEQDLIDELEVTPECQQLFSEVLGMQSSSVLLTDLSSLSDFTGRGAGAPDFVNLSWPQYAKVWDAWVVARIEEVFGVTISRTTMPLVQLIPLLRQNAAIH